MREEPPRKPLGSFRTYIPLTDTNAVDPLLHIGARFRPQDALRGDRGAGRRGGAGHQRRTLVGLFGRAVAMELLPAVRRPKLRRLFIPPLTFL